MSIATIKARVAALAEDTGWQTMPSDVLVGLVHVIGGDGDGIAIVHGNAAHLATPEDRAAFIAAARTDVELLLAVAEAARLLKAQCDDLCPSWQDEPCDCGMAALRDALAALEAGA